MSEAGQLGKALKSLCLALDREGASGVGLRLGLRLLAQPALKPYRDDPLRTLDGELPSLDALETALRQRLERVPAADAEIGGVWGALYLPAEGRAVAMRLRACVCEGDPGLVILRPLAPALLVSARDALRAARAQADRRDGLILLDIEAEGIDDGLLGAVAGDSLGFPLALAFLSTLRAEPLPLDLGATGAIGGADDGRLTPVEWVEKKREALAERGIRLLAPPDVATLGQAWRQAVRTVSVSGELAEPLTPLMGREREAASLIALLTQPGVRLVTLTGQGGVGKTRLALHVVRELSAAFPDGVWILSLAEAHEGGGLRERLATLLQTTPHSLADFLAQRRLLLLLDNCETALSEVAVLADLLRAAPHAVCLATSRVVLGLRGERRVEVDGLAPDDASALFLARARDADAEFAEDIGAIRETIVRLEGLPLAIELAASRVRMMPLAELNVRLDDALSLLATRSRDLPERQRTMRATLEWSVSFLEPDERRLLRGLAVFEGSFTARTAEALFEKDVLDSLTRLEEASLLKMERRSGEPRFRLLMLVKEYARELLRAEREGEYWENRHEEYFLKQALLSWEVGNRDIHRYDEYEIDIENFHAVFRRLSAKNTPFPAGAVAAMTRFLRRRGRWVEMEDWLARARRRPHAPLGAGDAARILLARAALNRLHGEMKQALRRTEASCRLASRASDELLLADALAIRATLSARAGNIAEALADLDRALLVYERLGDDLGQVVAQGNRGGVHWRAGRLTEAAADFEATFALAHRLGSRRDEAMAGLNLAAAYLKLDDALGAIRAAAASLEILHDLHDLSNQARTLSNLGAGLLRAGRPKAGRRCLEQARSLGRRARLEGDFFREIEALLPESAESKPEETDGIQWLRPVLQELLAG